MKNLNLRPNWLITKFHTLEIIVEIRALMFQGGPRVVIIADLVQSTKKTPGTNFFVVPNPERIEN